MAHYNEEEKKPCVLNGMALNKNLDDNNNDHTYKWPKEQKKKKFN